MNKSQNRTFSQLFHSHKILLLYLVGHFTDQRISLLFHILQILKSLPFHTNLKPEKGTPFGQSLQVQAIRYMEYLPWGWGRAQLEVYYLQAQCKYTI